MNRLKKMLASLLAFAMAFLLFPTLNTYASSITVDKSPLGTTIANTPIADLANQINAAGATYTYVDNDGNTQTGKVTADMCYLYGTFNDRVNINNATQTINSTELVTNGLKLGTNTPPSGSEKYLLTDAGTAMISLKVTDLARTDISIINAPGNAKKGNLCVGNGSYTLSVRVNDMNHNFTFNASVPVKVTWPNTLTKTSYWVGDALDLTGDYLTVTYSNGDTSKVPVTADMLFGISGSEKNRYVLSTIKASTYMNTPNTYSFAIAYKSINSTFSSGYGLNAGLSKDQFMAGPNVAATTNLVDVSSVNGPKSYEITVSAASGYTPKLRYSAHVQNLGWQGFYYSPNTAGTTGKSLRMEALKVQFVNYNSSMGTLEYMAHVQNIGDTKWITADEMVGTVGESKRMEGVAIRFTGKYAELYNVEYRVHCQGIGWTDWKKNGEYAGTKAEGKRMEAVEIRTSLK